jgi:hypothetical protein
MAGRPLPDDELCRLVVHACADDYEDFDMIVSEVTKWTKGDFKTPCISEIENALLKCIADGEVIGYEYSEKLHQFVAAEAKFQSNRTLWFYITEQSKMRFKQLEAEEKKAEA